MAVVSLFESAHYNDDQTDRPDMPQFVTEAQKRAFPTEIESVLREHGFQEMTDRLDSTEERVFGKRVDTESGTPLTMRVFTSVDARTNTLREKGSDAVRVALFTLDSEGEPTMVGAQKRVHRVRNWKENLRERLDSAEEDLIGPRCQNGHLMVKRDGGNGKFWGCSEYPRCTNTRPCKS